MENRNKLPISNTYRDVRCIKCKQPLRFVTIILVHDNVDTYHLDIFLENNPDTDVYIISDTRPDVEGFGFWYKWKNNDVLMREWWKNNKNIIKINKIFYMEYDVLVLVKVTDDMFIKGVRSPEPFSYYTDLSPQESWTNAPWFWGEDGDKLTKELKAKACSSMSVCMWFDSSALDCLVKTEWDEIYMSDIVADIRLATILNFNNVKLENCDNIQLYMKVSCHLKDIDKNQEVIKDIKLKKPGIYHPVKRPIDQF